MIKYLKEYRFYITLFFFILIPIVSIDTSTRAARTHHFHDRVIVAIATPFQALITWTLDQIVSGYQNYIFLWHTRKQNIELLRENRDLLNTIVDLRETQQENSRLRDLLSFREQFSLPAVAARVIAKDVSTEFRSVRINRGETDGIQKDMAVINSEGIVGRVFRTTATTADVITLLDLLSAVDTTVRRSRVRGIVEGMTDEFCQLKFTLRTDDVIPGDLLVSSGLGGIFPKGIPVGSVVETERKPFGITQRILVRPSVDFSKLEEVLVLTQVTTAPVHLREASDKK